MLGGFDRDVRKTMTLPSMCLVCLYFIAYYLIPTLVSACLCVLKCVASACLPWPRLPSHESTYYVFSGPDPMVTPGTTGSVNYAAHKPY
jgi:hypothetical protein